MSARSMQVLVLLTTVLCGGPTAVTTAQESATIEARIDSLQNERIRLADEIARIDSLSKALKLELTRIQVAALDQKRVYGRLRYTTTMRDADDNMMRNLYPSDEVLVLSGSPTWWKVFHQDEIGFIPRSSMQIGELHQAILKKRHIELIGKFRSEEEEIKSRRVWVARRKIRLRRGPSPGAEIVRDLPYRKEVYVQGEVNGWYDVAFNGPVVTEHSKYTDKLINHYVRGWVHVSLVSETEPPPRNWEEEEVRDYWQLRRQKFVENNPGLVLIFRQAILSGNIRIGMTTSMVEASWGTPTKRNRTVTAGAVDQQWVYGTGSGTVYVYFTDDVLTAWQD